MTKAFNGLDAAGMNFIMGLDQGVNSCLSLYHDIAALNSLLSLDFDHVCLVIS